MKKTVLAALLSAFIAAPVAAENMYAGFKMGKSRHNITGVTNSPIASGVFGGYKVNPDFAIEAGYIDLGRFGNVKASAADVSALFYYPGDESFSLYAKISYASTAWKLPGQAQHNSSFTHGFGFRYNISPLTTIRFAWDRYMIGNPDVLNVDVLSVAGIYGF
ncbi:MAG: outer membrane beta-barrel protein [Pseudomonadota bacterium]